MGVGARDGSCIDYVRILSPKITCTRTKSYSLHDKKSGARMTLSVKGKMRRKTKTLRTRRVRKPTKRGYEYVREKGWKYATSARTTTGTMNGTMIGNEEPRHRLMDIVRKDKNGEVGSC